jgi:cell division protein FtsZ
MGMAMMGTGIGHGSSRAREAAEAAIASPLLEDINLQGARGILVNITGGQDMAIGEFDEVGNVVREFASDDADVVIGMVIDPELHDEMRVTVVATGLSGMRQASEPTLKLVQKNTGEIDYGEMTRRPAMTRKHSQMEQRPEAKKEKEMDLEYLDIPAFLRRQAD